MFFYNFVLTIETHIWFCFSWCQLLNTSIFTFSSLVASIKHSATSKFLSGILRKNIDVNYYCSQMLLNQRKFIRMLPKMGKSYYFIQIYKKWLHYYVRSRNCLSTDDQIWKKKIWGYEKLPIVYLLLYLHQPPPKALWL